MTKSQASGKEPLSTADYSRLLLTTHKTTVIVTAGFLAFASIIYVQLNLDRSFLYFLFGCWTATLLLIYRGLRHHRYPKFGTANTVTTVRAAGAMVLASTLPVTDAIPSSDNAYWTLSLFVACLIALDGLDGYYARRERLSSDFGARFDMEVDAFLALVIALILWQTQQAGIWVLGLGLMRYVFVVWSYFSQPLRAELFPSLRRKTVCVIQLGALCLMLSPLLQNPFTQIIGLAALICLSASFFIDIVWLYKRSSGDSSKTD